MGIPLHHPCSIGFSLTGVPPFMKTLIWMIFFDETNPNFGVQQLLFPRPFLHPWLEFRRVTPLGSGTLRHIFWETNLCGLECSPFFFEQMLKRHCRWNMKFMKIQPTRNRGDKWDITFIKLWDHHPKQQFHQVVSPRIWFSSQPNWGMVCIVMVFLIELGLLKQILFSDKFIFT